MASYAADVLALLDSLGIERAVMAGLSMGGYILMQILRDAPQRVSAVILISTREVPDSDEARANRLRQAAEVEAAGTAGIIDAMLPKMVVRESTRGPVRAIMESASPAGVAAALRAMAARPDSAGTLRSIRVPALIIAGEKDAITPVADAQRMQSLVAGSRLAVIPDAAHLVNFEQPYAFNARVQEFLHSVDGTR